jgi:arylsulfatase A-like enzyme
LEAAWRQPAIEFSAHVCEAGACERVFREAVDVAEPEGRRWRECAVELEAHAGREVSFRFEAGPASDAAGADAVALPVWSNPTVFARAPRRPEQLNLLLISIDTLRADHLPTYGYARDTAPFLREAFERGGTVVETAVAAAATTGPSHATIFTGLQPSAHGVLAGQDLSPLVTTLADVLRAHGFTTGAVTENGPVNARRGLGYGFGSFRENRNTEVAQGQIEETFARARRWLERHRDRRFFLFVHTYQVHAPYTPPERYRRLFAAPPADARAESRRDEERAALYDAEIRYADDELRRFFDRLEALGLAGKTLIVLTSDHGEEFLEHGFLAHGANLHGEITHVPLLFRGPVIPRGARVRTTAGHADLMPTLLELAAVPGSPGAMGRSLARVLRGVADEEAEIPVYSETWRTVAVDARGQRVTVPSPTLAVEFGNRKLIRRPTADGSGFRYQYFDRSRDPGERGDLWPHQGPAARDLRELLDGYAAYAHRYRPVGRQPDAGAERIEPSQIEKLHALGYATP